MDSQSILKEIIKSGNKTYPIIDSSFYDGYAEECLENKDNPNFVVDVERLRCHTEDWHFLYIMSFFKSQIKVHDALSVIYRWVAVAINYIDVETNPSNEEFHDERNTDFIIKSDMHPDDFFYMRNLKTMDSMLMSLVRCGMVKEAVDFIEFDCSIHDSYLTDNNINVYNIENPIVKSTQYLKYVQFYAAHFNEEFDRELNYWRN